MKQTKLSEIIYTKDFDIAPNGYDPRQVDDFLDNINSQLVAIETKLDQLESDNQKLQEKVASLEQANNNLSKELSTTRAARVVNKATSSNYENLDLANRISSIEAMLKEILDKK